MADYRNVLHSNIITKAECLLANKHGTPVIEALCKMNTILYGSCSPPGLVYAMIILSSFFPIFYPFYGGSGDWTGTNNGK